MVFGIEADCLSVAGEYGADKPVVGSCILGVGTVHTVKCREVFRSAVSVVAVVGLQSSVFARYVS